MVTLVEFHEFLGRPFRDISMLEKALTAPGAEGDKKGDLQERIKYEGNRTLAQIGKPLHQLVVERRVFEGVPRGEMDDLFKSSFAQLEERARSIGFYDIIKLNPRQRGFVSARTLRLVFFAIVGAVYEHCGRNERNATDVVNRLCFSPLPSLEGNQTTSLLEPEMGHIADDWDNFIEIPESGPSSTINDIPSPDTLHNCWLVDLSPQVIPQLIHFWKPLDSALQQQDEIPPTPSFPPDDSLGSFSNMYETASYNTPPSFLIYSPNPDSSSQDASDIAVLSIPSASDTDVVSATKITAQTTVPAPAPTDLQHHAIAKSPSSRKRGSSRREIPPSQLSEYIGLEKKRCLTAGLTFLDSASQAYTSLLQILYFGIGSSEVLAMLQELLKTRRERFTAQQSREKRVLSAADRMRAIGCEDAKKAYTSFRKRCHVYQLFVDCSSESLISVNNFVTSTVQTMAIRRTPQIGNPLYLELSRISNRMFSLSYADLAADDPTYQQKKRYTNELRILGQRLHQLVEVFGFGILGLLPLPSNEPSLVQALNITDKDILRIPDNKFNPFVNYLDKKLGSVLRKMSRALGGVVEAIFDEETDNLEGFPIENCEQAQILQYPRGSPQLLQLLS